MDHESEVVRLRAARPPWRALGAASGVATAIGLGKLVPGAWPALSVVLIGLGAVGAVVVVATVGLVGYLAVRASRASDDAQPALAVLHSVLASILALLGRELPSRFRERDVDVRPAAEDGQQQSGRQLAGGDPERDADTRVSEGVNDGARERS